jgi:hypothetical protein
LSSTRVGGGISCMHPRTVRWCASAIRYRLLAAALDRRAAGAVSASVPEPNIIAQLDDFGRTTRWRFDRG